MKALLPILALILAVGLALSAAGPAAAQQSPTIQLAVLLDGSVSVDSTEWDIQINGLIAALEDPSCIPRDGSVELTVIQFGGTLSAGPPISYNPGAIVHISRMHITDASVAATAAGIVNTIIKIEGSSPMHEGILAAIDEIGGANALPGARQIINISTNGGTNRPAGLPRDLAEQARDDAIADEIDEISAEALGDIITGPYGENNHLWLQGNITYPQPGTIAPPFTPGWVYLGADQTDGIENAAEFTEAIGHKIPRYTLTMAVTGSGSTTPAVGPHDYTEGTVVDITANPAGGWQFASWTGDVADVNSDTTTVTVDTDKTVTANFSEALTIPNCPTELTLTPVSSSQIDLSWQYADSDNVDGFKIWRKLEGEAVYILIADVGSDVRNYSDTDLGSTYDYLVRAYNDAGLSPLDCDCEDSATTLEEGGGGCFIATAAYGSYLDSHVETLRDFRDSYMVNNPVGSALVSAYYKLSPPVADFIDDHPTLKPIVRAGLMPAVAMSTVALNTTSAEKIAIVGSLALVSVALAVWLSRRRGRGVIS